MPPKKLSKQIIIEESVAYISETGDSDIPMREIARRLGVKAPSLYNHFNSMTELRYAVYQYSIDRFVTTLEESVADKTGDEAIIAFAESYHDFAMRNRGLYTLIMSIPSDNDRTGFAIALPLLDLAVSILSEYDLDDTSIAHWQRVFRAFLHGFVSQEYLGSFYHYGDVSVDDSRKVAIRCFLDGLHDEVERIHATVDDEGRRSCRGKPLAEGCCSISPDSS